MPCCPISWLLVENSPTSPRARLAQVEYITNATNTNTNITINNTNSWDNRSNGNSRLDVSGESEGSAAGHALEEGATGFGSGQARGNQWEFGGSSRTSTGRPNNDQRSLAQGEVITSWSRYVSSLPNGTDRRTSSSTRLGPATAMQSASVAPSGLNRSLSVSDQVPNSGLGPGIPLATDTGPDREPERALPTPGGLDNNANTPPNRKANRAAIKVASINMRGYGGQNALSPQNNWQHVNQVMREEKIAVLLVQETHMNEERQSQVDSVFSKRMKIYSSANPENPTGKGGVAVVINKGLLDTRGSNATVIVPGRAMSVQVKWHKEEVLTVLVVYAPNESGENREFWKLITNYYRDNVRAPKPNVMAGDFNIVEDPIDRLPMHSDRADAVEALDELKLALRLQDGWRNTFPSTKAFTYLQSNGTRSQSRIDRIYTTALTFETAREWTMGPSGIPNADHRMVSVKIVNEASPKIGKGRWSIPKHLLKDKILSDFVMKSGIEAKAELDRLNGTRTEEQNPQRILDAFKKKIIEAARLRDRAIVPKILQELRKCEEELGRINNDVNKPEGEKVLESSKITQRITELERKRHLKRRTEVAVRNRIEGETISRYWTQTNKEIKPRDVFYALRKPHVHGVEDIYESSSNKMAELARDYHESLQKEGILNMGPEAREESLKRPMQAIEAEVTPAQREDMKMKVSRDEVKAALKAAKDDTAAGLDGVTYELWKVIHASCEKAAKENKPGFDVLDLMTAAFNDIETNGIDKSTRFAEGWMCPIYKKNDPNEIANYRPITILNTDYKILTKVLAIRLAQVAPSLLHKSQAGFVPGRKITDQTKLVELMVAYAEAAEQNGLIVALDQEKAYDKVAHDYLWRALETFLIPPEFLKTVKTLYEQATTRVMINGHLSSSFKVIRGVRQGDPMSCLLFDLAIEPLSAMLRQSALKGYQIPGNEEKLIVNLFADDTTAFLSEEDSFADLEIVLNSWCQASTAKFNVAKTEVIPIGSREFRELVIETRKAGEHHERIPDNVHIVRDGEAIRSLGAWVGNEIDSEGVWTSTLEKIDQRLAQWEKSHPTMEGRRLIVQMIVGGMTQYLTQVQGMPKEIEKRITKRVRKFMWNEKQMSPVNEETLYAPIEVGGRAVLDITSRNEAIAVMWLKSYLSFGPNRPIWASVADALMATKVPTSERNIEVGIRKNVFLQSWKTYSGNKAPECLRNLLLTAKNFGVRPEGLFFSRETLRMMPIWLHREADKKIRRMNHQETSNCLRTKHLVESVGEAERVADSLDDPAHVDCANCLCKGCVEAGDEKGCENPPACFKRARQLLSTIPPKWNPKTGWIDDGRPLSKLERGMVCTGGLQEIFRVFTQGQTSNLLPQRLAGAGGEAQAIETITTGAESARNDAGRETLGVGVFFDDNDARNLEVCLPSIIAQTAPAGELLAVKLAAEGSSIEKRMHLQCKFKSTEILFKEKIEKMENTGYIGVKNMELIQATVAAIRKRGNESTIKCHGNRNSDPKAMKAAESAKRGTRMQAPDEIALRVPPTLKLTGAKLSSMTQSLAYKAIRSQKMKNKYKKRRLTEINLQKAKEEMKNISGTECSEESLWRAIRHKDISRMARYFLWMSFHDAYMVGSNWLRPGFAPEYQERSECKSCNKTETMEHILTECEAPGQAEIWTMVETMWSKRSSSWPKPTLGVVLASAALKFQHRDHEKEVGDTRLYRILMSESAYLIWKIRCERVIREETATPAEVCRRWEHMISSRIDLDKNMSSSKYGRKALDKNLVKCTWKGTLQDNIINVPDPPGAGEAGVLVGMTT